MPFGWIATGKFGGVQPIQMSKKESHHSSHCLIDLLMDFLDRILDRFLDRTFG